MARIIVVAALFMCCAFALSSAALFNSFVTMAHAAVIGIDMGAENIVLSTPGYTDLDSKVYNTVEIVLNMQSHRKTANWIGFRNGERFFAEDAMNLAPRFPDLMTAAPHRFVGLLYNDTSLQSYMKGQHFPYAIKPHPTRGTVVFEYPNAGEGGETLTYTAEELLSMMFGHIKRTVEASTQHNEPASAAVVTVPHFFTERQRQAIIDAAALVGLRVLSLQHPTTAAAVQYGIQNDGFGGKATNAVIVDMGSGATHVGIYRYGGTESQGIRKPRFNIGYGNLTALALVSSSQISGRVLDACVARHIEDEFVTKTGLPRILSGSTLQQRKAIISLMRTAKKVKETLTANRFALYTVEGMAPDKEFSSRMTREFFEENCVADFAVEIGKLVDRALEKAGQKLAVIESGAADIATIALATSNAKPLPSAAIDRLEVIGGGIRVLKLLSELTSHAGRNVGRTMNSDEAAAIGAGYRVAGLSGAMRYKGFALQDTAALAHSVSFTVKPLTKTTADETNSDIASAASPLFTVGQEAFLPARRVLFLGALNGDGAVIDLIYTLPSASSAGEVRKDRSITVSGLSSALNTVKYFSDFQREHNATHHVKVELSVSEAGIISIDAASVDVSYAVNATKTYKVPKNATKAANETEAADEASDDKAKAEADEKKAKADEKDSKKTDKVEEETKTVVTVKRRRRTFPLTISVAYLRAPLPLTLEDARKSKAILKKLDSRDEASFKLAATHNDLQSYLIWARGDGFGRYRSKLTEEEKAALDTLLADTNTWVEDVATEATPRAEVREKLVVLRDGVRKFMAAADERPDEEAGSGSDDSNPFASAPEPIAHSDDFIEDDGVRGKKAKKSAKKNTEEDKKGDGKISANEKVETESSAATADTAAGDDDVASVEEVATEDDSSAADEVEGEEGGSRGEDATEGEF